MVGLLLDTNKWLPIKKSKKGSICSYKSPVGNIRVQISGEVLTRVEYDLLKKFVEMAKAYDEKGNVYALDLKKSRDPFGEMPEVPISKLKGLISQFSAKELLECHNDAALEAIVEEKLALLIDKLSRMGISVDVKAGSKQTSLGFRAINEFRQVGNRYVIDIHEHFAIWIITQTTWLDIYNCLCERNRFGFIST